MRKFSLYTCRRLGLTKVISYECSTRVRKFLVDHFPEHLFHVCCSNLVNHNNECGVALYTKIKQRDYHPRFGNLNLRCKI